MKQVSACVARSWRLYRFPVYIKTMQRCSSMFDTSLQSFQRQNDQEVHVISCFFPLRSRRNAICVLHTRKWRHPCTLWTIISRSTRFWYYNFLLSLF
jgi:hypothetical protein